MFLWSVVFGSIAKNEWGRFDFCEKMAFRKNDIYFCVTPGSSIPFSNSFGGVFGSCEFISPSVAIFSFCLAVVEVVLTSPINGRMPEDSTINAVSGANAVICSTYC